MRPRLAAHLLTCALTGPAVIAGTYTVGLAMVVTDVHLFERAMLERAPRSVLELAHVLYGDLIPIYTGPFTYCNIF